MSNKLQHWSKTEGWQTMCCKQSRTKDYPGRNKSYFWKRRLGLYRPFLSPKWVVLVIPAKRSVHQQTEYFKDLTNIKFSLDQSSIYVNKKTFPQNPLFSLDQYYELYKRLKVVQTLMRCLSRNSVHTSRSGQDSYVSKGGPLGVGGDLAGSHTCIKHLGWKKIEFT